MLHLVHENMPGFWSFVSFPRWDLFAVCLFDWWALPAFLLCKQNFSAAWHSVCYRFYIDWIAEPCVGLEVPVVEVAHGVAYRCLHCHQWGMLIFSQQWLDLSVDLQLHSESSSLCIAWKAEHLRGTDRQVVEQWQHVFEACTCAVAAALFHHLVPCAYTSWEVLRDRVRDVALRCLTLHDRMWPALSCVSSTSGFLRIIP